MKPTKQTTLNRLAQLGMTLALVLLSALPSLGLAQAPTRSLTITTATSGVVSIATTAAATVALCGIENRYDSAVPGASTPRSLCRRLAPLGTQIALTATPNPYYRFIGWLGDCTGSNAELTITLNANHRCQAVFAKPDGYVQIAASVGTDTYIPQHVCAVTNLGRIHCWGAGASGQIGDDMDTNRDIPTVVSGITNAIGVSTGGLHTCAILRDGAVRCWGLNNDGQLGDGTRTPRSVPTAVVDISTAVAVSAGEEHTCALLANGQVWCWGNNANGELGDSTDTRRLTPVAALGVTNVVAVSTGRYYTCVVLADGAMRCWGVRGRLGNGSSSHTFERTTVTDITNAVAISAGRDHTCAVLANGQVWCWGQQKVGRLGNGATGSGFALNPVAVTGINTAIAVTAGNAHTCAVLSDGQAQCWGASGADSGSNIGGDASQARLGTGSTGGSTTPVDVANLRSVTSIAAGRHTSCALLRNGLAYCWGSDADGVIGDGIATTATGYTAPQLVANQALAQTPIRTFAVRNAPFIFQPKVEDSADTITWSLTPIPAGLRISTRTGIIYGTPQEAGAQALIFGSDIIGTTTLSLNRDTDRGTSLGNFALTLAVVTSAVADGLRISNNRAPAMIAENSPVGTTLTSNLLTSGVNLNIDAGDEDNVFGFGSDYARWTAVNNNTPFQITPDGTVRVSSALDYETPPTQYTLTVQAALPAIGRTLPAFPVPIAVTNVIESIATTDTSPGTNTIRSNAGANERVNGLQLEAREGTLDITNDVIWTLEGSDAFHIDRSGNVLTSASFNLSTGTSVNLTIVSSQSSVISNTLTVGVTVTEAIHAIRFHLKLFLEGPLR